MPSRPESKQAGVVDVADFADKNIEGAYPDDTVFGDVPFVHIPDIIGKGQKPTAKQRAGGGDVPSSGMGDLTSTGDTGNAGDVYE